MSKFKSEDLCNYLALFPEQQRDNVVKALVDESILKEAFDTDSGKLILAGVVDSIRDNVIKIIKGSADLDYKKVKEAAMEINVLYKIIYQWGKVIKNGEHHTEKMRNK